MMRWRSFGATSDLLARRAVVSEETACEQQETARVGGSGFLQPLSLPPSGTPKGVDFTAVRDLLLSVEGVEALHSLHIWALTASQPVLSVHIAIGEWSGRPGRGEREAPRGLGPSLKQPTTSDVCGAGASNLAPCRVLYRRYFI